MAEKAEATKMVLKVDLQCRKCYKKVKKLLCKFPEIQDQVYDEKNNKVTIKVVCCCPEKVRDKLCCKGRECIKSIEILKPPDKQPQTPTPPPPPPPPIYLTVRFCCAICCNGSCKGPCYNPCYCYGQPVRYCGGYCGRPVCDGWCGGVVCGGYCGRRCGESYCDSTDCTIL